MHCTTGECTIVFFFTAKSRLYWHAEQQFVTLPEDTKTAARLWNVIKGKQTVRRREQILFFFVINFCNDPSEMALPIHECNFKYSGYTQIRLALTASNVYIIVRWRRWYQLYEPRALFHIGASTRVHRKSRFCFVTLWTSSPCYMEWEFYQFLNAAR